MSYLGLDLGATNVKGALVDDEGGVLAPRLGTASATERRRSRRKPSRTRSRAWLKAACATGPPCGPWASARPGGLRRRDYGQPNLFRGSQFPCRSRRSWRRASAASVLYW